MSSIISELKAEAKGFTSWQVENVVDFPDKVLPQCDVILNSDYGEILTAGGILQLTGKGKVGKSMLLLNILFGLATGRDSLGFGIPKPRRVVYLNGENSSRTMQGRLRLLRDYFAVDDEEAERLRENLLFVNGGFSLQKPEVMQDIRGNLAEIRPEVLVIDPLKNFYSGEENSADDMRKFVTALRSLVDEFGLAICVIHHTGKNQRIDIYSGRGSSLLADDAETTIAFYEDASNKGVFNLSVTGRNCDEFTQCLIKQPERWYLYCLTDRPEVKPDHILIEILEKLPDQFKTGAFEEFASQRAISKRSMFDALKALQNAGYIKWIKRGLYEKVSAAHCANEMGSIPEVHNMPESADCTPNNTETESTECEDIVRRTCSTPNTSVTEERKIVILEPVDDYRGLF